MELGPYGVRVTGGPVEQRAVAATAEVTYEAAARALLPGLCAGLAAVFAVAAALHSAIVEAGPRWLTVATAALLAALLTALGLALRTRRLRHPGRARGLAGQAAASAVLFVTAAAAVLHVVRVTQPAASWPVAFVLVAAGAVLLAWRWWALTVGLTWTAWGAGVLLGGGGASWVRWGAALGSATVLSLAVQQVRRADLRLLVTARAAAEAAAVRDGLTGLANRRGLAMVGAQMVEQARRQGDAVHAVFVTIDGLKAVNDTLGTAVGDEVIVAVGEALRAATRGTDVVARWGGAEFCLVGPGPGMAPLELERRVREGVVLTGVPAEVWPVRLSTGGAMLAPWDAGTLETLLGKADQEMHLRRSLRTPAGLPRRQPARSDAPPTATEPGT